MRISDWSSDVCSSDLEGGGDHLGAAIVAVLAQLHHQHARAAALLALERLDLALDAAEALVAFVGGAVDAGHRANERAVAGVDLLQRIRNLSTCRAHSSRLHCGHEHVVRAGPRSLLPYGSPCPQ